MHTLAFFLLFLCFTSIFLTRSVLISTLVHSIFTVGIYIFQPPQRSSRWLTYNNRPLTVEKIRYHPLFLCNICRALTIVFFWQNYFNTFAFLNHLVSPIGYQTLSASRHRQTFPTLHILYAYILYIYIPLSVTIRIVIAVHHRRKHCAIVFLFDSIPFISRSYTHLRTLS